MKVYGLTGGIGMGKSASHKLLRERGMPVVDTDEIARGIVEPGQPALAEIQVSFGSQVIAADGTLRRDELARQVFAEAAARARLEEILHPRIRAIWREQIGKWRAEGRTCAVVIIPLLFETHAEAEFDQVVCVACSAETQMNRLRERGWDQVEIANRIAAQWPVEKKIELANYVIWTEGGLDVHAAQLERIFA